MLVEITTVQVEDLEVSTLSIMQSDLSMKSVLLVSGRVSDIPG